MDGGGGKRRERKWEGVPEKVGTVTAIIFNSVFSTLPATNRPLAAGRDGPLVNANVTRWPLSALRNITRLNLGKKVDRGVRATWERGGRGEITVSCSVAAPLATRPAKLHPLAELTCCRSSG